MNRGDVYDARLDPAEGSEQAGTRPVLIVSRDAINQNSSVVVIAPFTNAANIGRSYPSNVLIAKDEGGLSADSVLLGGQVRAITKSRLLHFRGSLSEQALRLVDRALRITLDL